MNGRGIPFAPKRKPAAVQLLADLPRSAGSRWVIPGRKPGTLMVRLGNAWRLRRGSTVGLEARC